MSNEENTESNEKKKKHIFKEIKEEEEGKKTFSANALIARPRHIIREQLLKQLFDRNAKMSCLVSWLWFEALIFHCIFSACAVFVSLRQIELGLHI